MEYEITVLDSEKKTAARLSGLVYARLREKVNGMALLTAKTVERSEWEHIEVGKSFLRVTASPGGTYATFRVTEVVRWRERETPGLTITARHVLADTADEVFADALDCVNHTPQELMETVLAHSSFAPGTVEPAAAIPFVRFEYEPVWECLLRVCSLTGGELALDEETGEISLLASVGEDNGAVFRYGLNLKGAARSVDTSRLANRVYGVGGGEPPMTLESATGNGGKKYVEDAESISKYGLREAVRHEPTLEEVTNLVLTPALDGAYTDGLCEDWTNLDAAVSGNTNPDYCLYGRASQRVQTSAAGQGIEQEVAVTPGTTYSLLAHVFIASGTVRVLVEDGAATYKRAEPVTGTGLAAVRIEGWKANNAAVTVKIVQEGAGTADFYVDSVQVAEGARAKPFTVGKSADILLERASEYLDAHKEPRIVYDVDVADLHGDPQAGYGAERFGLGDTVRVVDETLDMDVTTRVMEREADLLRPRLVRVRLDNASRTLADVLAAVREAQEEGIRRTRAVLAGSSRAAEAGSRRLGFSRLAFRFFGTITADSWNGVSWSAGTFRAGDFYYSVASGSAAGLAASTTYYFYFDRTNPATFGHTTAASEAESDDRLTVFAVKTTTSPDLCRIYPLGIIHE